ncbi:unnamed protein product [Heterosigma akashiwo]|mmetsp:Transcript_20807/g.39151  ORF Transcript_20807/g.39151 Transcript_20807/m.39151 type:complete len:111 (-) Transcript_20807:257-589(-)
MLLSIRIVFILALASLAVSTAFILQSNVGVARSGVRSTNVVIMAKKLSDDEVIAQYRKAMQQLQELIKGSGATLQVISQAENLANLNENLMAENLALKAELKELEKKKQS